MRRTTDLHGHSSINGGPAGREALAHPRRHHTHYQRDGSVAGAVDLTLDYANGDEDVDLFMA
jgi:hypothetical protein